MHEDLQARGVKFYALNVPWFNENAQTLAAFEAQVGVTFPVLDHHGTENLISFGGTNTYPFPRDVVVDQNLRIVWSSTDYDGPGLRAVLDALLAHPPPAD